MALTDLLRFENPEFVAIMLGLLLFVVVFKVLQNWRIDRGPALLISIIIGIFAMWSLFRNGLIYNSEFLVGLFAILAIAIVLLIFKGFLKFAKRSFS